MIYTFQTLTDYCIDNKVLLENEYKDIKITRESYIEGKCIIDICSNKFNKTLTFFFI